MPVPNTLTRIITKEEQIVPFDLSRVQNSIEKTIRDATNVSSWEAKERALKYSELVRDQVWDSFYNLSYIMNFFSKIINSFDEKEIEERIERKEFGIRMIGLLYLTYLDETKAEILSETDHAALKNWIATRLGETLKSEDLKLKVASLYASKVIKKHLEGVTTHDQFPTREFIQNTIESVLKQIGEVSVSEAFMLYRQGRIMVQDGEITEAQFSHDGIHRDRVRQTLTWNIRHECDSIFKLNDWVAGSYGQDFKELMALSDKRFYDDISQVVGKIVGRANDIKVAIIAGPSCSNKTTTTTVIEKELAKHGLKLRQLNIDDYFFNLSEHPKDEFGDYDYEMPEAIDMDLLNKNLDDLIHGRETQVPHYNFKTGMRDNYSSFKIEKDEIILIDCLHGLYSPLTKAVPPHQKFKIFTESSNMLRSTAGDYTKWTDARLAKRMIRDVLYRGHSISKTLGHWAYVRKGELKHIIPYIYSVDAVLNSGLPYELPILKSILADKIPTKEELTELRYEGRLDAYIRGIRLRSLFDTIIAYENIDHVDKFSPLREFIGGSGYDLAHND